MNSQETSSKERIYDREKERGEGEKNKNKNSRQRPSANLGRISGARQGAVGVGKFVGKRIQIGRAPAFATVLEPREDIASAAIALREACLDRHAR